MFLLVGFFAAVALASPQVLEFKLTLDLRVPSSFSAPIPLAYCNVTNFDVAHLPKALVAGRHVYNAAIKGKIQSFANVTMAVYEYNVACKFGANPSFFTVSFDAACVSDVNSIHNLQCLSAGCGSGGPGSWDGLFWSTTSKKCDGASGTVEIEGN